MKKYGRTDDNQKRIVSALRKAGCSVVSLASVGEGCPDLLCGRAGINYLLEIKDGSKSPSRRRLTSDQSAWHSAWAGTVYIVIDEDTALRAVGIML